MRRAARLGLGAPVSEICPKCGQDKGTIQGAVLHADGCTAPAPVYTAADRVVSAYLGVIEDLAARDELEERARLARQLAGSRS